MSEKAPREPSEGPLRPFEPRSTAVVLVGMQNDLFSPHGAIHAAIESQAAPARVLGSIVSLVDALVATDTLVMAAPITFTPDYSELVQPVGVLASIKKHRALQHGTGGAQIVAELGQFGPRIVEVQGRRGLNAFVGTSLETLLTEHGVTDVVIAGSLTSVCVDSTGRSAFDRGYRVSVLADCTLARTFFEQRFFVEQIFPIYAQVLTSAQLLERLGVAVGTEP